MDVRLLRRYREMARKKFFLIEEREVYSDKKELMTCYFLCKDGKKIWIRKNYIYQCSLEFDKAQQLLREYRTRYVEYLVANEKTKRTKVKQKRLKL